MPLLFIPLAVKIWMTLLIIACGLVYAAGKTFKHIPDDDPRLDNHEFDGMRIVPKEKDTKPIIHETIPV